jgi:hypothetical protein
MRSARLFAYLFLIMNDTLYAIIIGTIVLFVNFVFLSSIFLSCTEV